MKRTLKIKWWFPLAATVILAMLALLSVREKRAAWTGSETVQTPVLVIDAGHGGADGGAVAADGTQESDINLDIALRLRDLARFWGTEPVMTRQGSDISYPADAESIAQKKVADQHSRLELINATPGAVLLSIHQNKYPAAAPSGIQVFYGAEAGSEELAKLTQGNLTAQLCPNNRRVAAPADRGVYLMKNAACRAMLVECGFLSNPEELIKLKTDAYRLELAAVLLASYMQYTRGTVT